MSLKSFLTPQPRISFDRKNKVAACGRHGILKNPNEVEERLKDYGSDSKTEIIR